MLESLITSKTRVKLLLKFFLNPSTSAYLRALADEFGESTNGVRVELNRLLGAGLLECADEGRTKVYRANTKHPLFPELQAIASKTLGIDQVVEHVISRLGNVELALVTGDYASGIDSGLIDLVLVGKIDRTYFESLAGKIEGMIQRKIRPLFLTRDEFARLRERITSENTLLLWGDKSELA
ncbi:MAG: ArsR family transcriptional regulator [Synergistaceae bacterium]|nr:ArsR family transcriptional regulator [Synergistota bacterium]NLM72349.1 ArsR family transcriptional regulator [Synergistaceae bacterium]